MSATVTTWWEGTSPSPRQVCRVISVVLRRRGDSARRESRAAGHGSPLVRTRDGWPEAAVARLAEAHRSPDSHRSMTCVICLRGAAVACPPTGARCPGGRAPPDAFERVGVTARSLMFAPDAAVIESHGQALNLTSSCVDTAGVGDHFFVNARAASARRGRKGRLLGRSAARRRTSFAVIGALARPTPKKSRSVRTRPKRGVRTKRPLRRM
jgi:hypothetical protein